MVNQADHRAVGLATLDAVADAGNRWLHTDLADEGLEPWGGVTRSPSPAAPRPTHFVDVSGEHFEAAVHSLEAHTAYNAALPRGVPAAARAARHDPRRRRHRPQGSSTPRSSTSSAAADRVVRFTHAF